MRKANQTHHPLIGDVLRAQRINRLLGFGAIHPWQVKDLTDEWMDVIDGMDEIRKASADEAKSKNDHEIYLQKRRAAHPTYRKR